MAPPTRAEPFDRVEFVTQQCEADASVEHASVLLGAEGVRQFLETSRFGPVAQTGVRKSRDEQRARIVDARRRDVLHGRLDSRREVPDRVPAGCELLNLEQERHPMEPVMRRELARGLIVEDGVPARVLEEALRDVAGDAAPIDVGDVIRVADPVEQRHATLGERARIVVAALR